MTHIQKSTHKEYVCAVTNNVTNRSINAGMIKVNKNMLGYQSSLHLSLLIMRFFFFPKISILSFVNTLAFPHGFSIMHDPVLPILRVLYKFTQTVLLCLPFTQFLVMRFTRVCMQPGSACFH